ncbi:MAG: V-type ATP synthase subunit F [Candidatus Omnitrophica bacterium]|nr:V-type ATP synthase subunit F [Candidatus Omnitrophota bacterium]MDE2222855.1 V-type ATP synthase subunit F [Candidatus Omnitrophota bacterium]
MKVFCIADEDTVTGFRLAGVQGHAATTPGQARDLVLSAAARPEVGLIIISEKTAGMIRPEIDAFLLDREGPLIVEVPDAQGPAHERKTVADIVRGAVGISL